MTLMAKTSNEAGLFDEQARDVLQRLRRALVDVIEAIPGRIAKATDLQRALKIDMKLTWKIFKVATATDPLAAGRYVPGAATMRKFLKAAARQGVPPSTIDAGLCAAADFERLVATHADDRSSFDSMISAYESGDAAQQVDVMHRRAAFRANSHIWGMRARTQLKCVIMQPGDKPTMLDVAGLSGFVNLRQLRAGVPLIVSGVRLTDDVGVVRKQYVREPLDHAAQTTCGLALLEEFCSKPLPEFRVFSGQEGFVHGRIVNSAVGNTAAITCIEGNVTRSAVARYRDEHNQVGLFPVRPHTPSQVVILDMLVREGTFEAITPKLVAYADHVRDTEYPAPSEFRVRLPIRESAVYLGKGPLALDTPDVPRYTEMARYVFDRLGWHSEAFDVYRCRVEYPIMFSTVVMRFELPEKKTE